MAKNKSTTIAAYKRGVGGKAHIAPEEWCPSCKRGLMCDANGDEMAPGKWCSFCGEPERVAANKLQHVLCRASFDSLDAFQEHLQVCPADRSLSDSALRSGDSGTAPTNGPKTSPEAQVRASEKARLKAAARQRAYRARLKG